MLYLKTISTDSNKFDVWLYTGTGHQCWVIAHVYGRVGELVWRIIVRYLTNAFYSYFRTTSRGDFVFSADRLVRINTKCYNTMDSLCLHTFIGL